MNEYECALCAKVLKSRRYIVTHLKKCISRQSCKSSKKMLKCSYCERYFSSLTGITYHTNKVHLKITVGPSSPIGCPYCPRQFPSRIKVESHVAAHHTLTNDSKAAKSVKCMFCSAVFFSRKGRLSHTKKHHNAEYAYHMKCEEEKLVARKIFKCFSCEKSFTTKFARSKHEMNCKISDEQLNCADDLCCPIEIANEDYISETDDRDCDMLVNSAPSHFVIRGAEIKRLDSTTALNCEQSHGKTEIGADLGNNLSPIVQFHWSERENTTSICAKAAGGNFEPEDELSFQFVEWCGTELGKSNSSKHEQKPQGSEIDINLNTSPSLEKFTRDRKPSLRSRTSGNSTSRKIRPNSKIGEETVLQYENEIITLRAKLHWVRGKALSLEDLVNHLKNEKKISTTVADTILGSIPRDELLHKTSA